MKKKLSYSLLVFISVLLIFILWVCIDEKSKTYTVGVINSLPSFDKTIAGFKERMNELGYREGGKIRYLYHGSTTDMSKLPEVARKLLEARVDIIFSITTPATIAVKEVVADTGLPVVFAVVTDPVGADIIESIKNPGWNITGVAFGIQEVRRLEWFVKIAPKICNIYIPYNPGDKSPVLALKMVKNAAAKLGLKLITRKVYDKKTLKDAVLNIPAQADAVFLMPDSLLSTRLSDIVATANRRRLPTSGANINVVKSAHVLTSFGFDKYRSGKQAARLVDLIFRGSRPAEMPVELADFYLAINLKVAKKIGLKVPENILRQANIIIR